MILKNSFIKLLKEDGKRRVWSIALLTLLFFVLMPVIGASHLDHVKQFYDKKVILDSMTEIIISQNNMVMVLTIAAAVLCGISGFFYLHSKKKVDFYHSVPVKRKTLFAVNYINGLLIYFIPYLINLILFYITLSIRGLFYSKLIHMTMTALLVNVVFYCIIYTIVVIAVMLTGNFIISCFGTAVLLLYGPTLLLVKEEYFRSFFHTYYPIIRLESCLRFASPIWSYVNVIEQLQDGGSITNSIIIACSVIILLIALALYLYLKRPSEAAGKAMVFPLSKPVIKFMLVILLSLAGGVLFYGIVNSSDGWFVFGLSFSLLVVYAAIEIIYNFDIRGAFRHKKQLLLCAFIVACVAVVFRFDLLHFDDYLPKQDKIESMAVAVENFEDGVDYFKFIDDRRKWYSNEEYQLEYMQLTDLTAAYDLAKLGRAFAREKKSNTSDSYSGSKNIYVIKFNLKNGKTVYRKYYAEKQQSMEYLSTIYSNKDYKLIHYPVLQWKMENVGRIYLRYFSEILNMNEFGMDGNNSFTISEGSVNKQKFLDTYREELMSLTLEEMQESLPLIEIRFEVGDDIGKQQNNEVYASETASDYNIYSTDGYYIYPSFVKTLALLKQMGFDTEAEVTAHNITKIDLYDERGEADELRYSFTAAQEINEFLPVLIPRSYYYYNRAFLERDDSYVARLSVYNKNYNEEFNYGFVLRKNKLPDLIGRDGN